MKWELDDCLIALALMIITGFFTHATVHHDFQKVTGMELKAIENMRAECELSIPRNQTCELVFVPSETINGRMVEEPDTGTN